MLTSMTQRNMESKGVASVPSPVACLRDVSFTVDHASFCETVTREFYKAYEPTRSISEVGSDYHACVIE
jgi:lipoate-protein ligase A